MLRVIPTSDVILGLRPFGRLPDSLALLLIVLPAAPPDCNGRDVHFNAGQEVLRGDRAIFETGIYRGGMLDGSMA